MGRSTKTDIIIGQALEMGPPLTVGQGKALAVGREGLGSLVAAVLFERSTATTGDIGDFKSFGCGHVPGTTEKNASSIALTTIFWITP